MEGGDNYLAELGAQVRWAWETKAKRYVVILDALSCPESLRRYVWMGDKKRAATKVHEEGAVQVVERAGGCGGGGVHLADVACWRVEE